MSSLSIASPTVTLDGTRMTPGDGRVRNEHGEVERHCRDVAGDEDPSLVGSQLKDLRVWSRIGDKPTGWTPIDCGSLS